MTATPGGGSLEGWTTRRFTGPLTGGGEVAHDVHELTAGADAPVVVLVQELPGIGPRTLALARRLQGDGFTVVMPHLFGPLGRDAFAGNLVRVFCMRREFHLFARRRTSPVVGWLRALCRDARDRHGVRGVAVIGMCLTGGFALSLLADDAVLTGFASQPSLPLFAQGALHMSDGDVAEVRAALDRKGPAMAARFAKDPLCTAAKLAAIDAAFNDDGAERVRTTTLPGAGHAILTHHFRDEDGSPTRAVHDAMIARFREALA